MQLQFYKTELLLKETFSIAYGNYDKRDALVIKLSHLGCEGFGECVAINYYGINLQEFILKLMIHSEKTFKNIAPFQEKTWYQVYFQEKIYNTLSSQKKWRARIEKQIKFKELI